MREVHATVDLGACAPGRAGEIAEAIHRDRNRLGERRGEEGRAEVREVVLDFTHFALERFPWEGALELTLQARALAPVADAIEHERDVRTVGREIGHLA